MGGDRKYRKRRRKKGDDDGDDREEEGEEEDDDEEENGSLDWMADHRVGKRRMRAPSRGQGGNRRGDFPGRRKRRRRKLIPDHETRR